MSEKKLNIIIIILIFLNLILAGSIYYLARTLSIKIPGVFVALPYSPANIVVDAKNIQGPLRPFWLGFAQGGEETGNMLSSTVGQMKRLNPSYVRLDHIFDDDYYGVVSGSSGNLRFDWTKLDKAVDDILAMGAKPFFSLGYMPSALASSKIAVPYNWNDWFTLVKATVEHYSGRNGKNITGVYYEVWNEPDLELFGQWSRGGEKNYLTLYEYAVRGAMAASQTQPFYIGGPATTGLYKNWILDLYQFVSQKGLRLDFISWHRYSFNPEQFSLDIADVYSWLKGQKMPRLVISEWGPTPEKNQGYASVYAAAHAFAVIRELLDLLTLTTVFEIKDGPGQGNVGWGLLPHETAGLSPKPRFHAFSWLAQVKGERLFLTGEGSNVKGWATKEKDKITVWLVNFGQGAVLEGVPVEIGSLPPGRWRLTREVLFGQKSSTEIVVGKEAKTQSKTVKATLELRPNQIGRVILTKI